MAKPLCDKCGVRFAQHFNPRRCRACLTGRDIPPPSTHDYSDAEIERRFSRAMAEIKARNRMAEPSREYCG